MNMQTVIKCDHQLQHEDIMSIDGCMFLDSSRDIIIINIIIIIKVDY